MPFNAAGVFNRLYSWVTDRQNGIRIMAQRVDAEMDGMAGGLTNTICRDGQSTTIARIPFAQGIAIETGTSGSPSFSVIGDPDTGVDFPAAGDTGALVAGGADVLTWTKGNTTVSAPGAAFVVTQPERRPRSGSMPTARARRGA